MIVINNTYFQTWNDLFEITENTLLLIFLSSVGIYIAVILYTRLFGKRSFSKMSSFDFSMTVAVGSMIATTILSSSVNLIEGAIGLLAVGHHWESPFKPKN